VIEGKVCDYLKWLFISQTPDPYNHVQHQLKGLCLFQLFTHRTQRPWFVSCVHPPHSKDFVCFMCSPTALKGLGLFHVFTHRTQRTWFVSCVHPPHSKDFVCFMCSQTALKGLCLFRLFTNRTQRTLFVSFVHPPHSTDFVCFICSPTAVKGLCLFHVITHRTQRTLFVSCVRKPHSKDFVVAECRSHTSTLVQQRMGLSTLEQGTQHSEISNSDNIPFLAGGGKVCSRKGGRGE